MSHNFSVKILKEIIDNFLFEKFNLKLTNEVSLLKNFDEVDGHTTITGY